MPCAWCGTYRKVGTVRRNGLTMPGPVPGIPLHLCPTCWGSYRESGLRPDTKVVPPGTTPTIAVEDPGRFLRALGRR